jgi:hypothetical protein
MPRRALRCVRPVVRGAADSRPVQCGAGDETRDYCRAAGDEDNLRVPGWTDEGGSVEVNGTPLERSQNQERISRWSCVASRRSCKAEAADAPVDGAAARRPTTQAVLYGPLVLAADLGDGPAEGLMKILHGRGTTPKNAGAPLPNPAVRITRRTAQSAPEWVDCVSASDLSFRAQGVAGVRAVLPMCRIRDQNYAVSWDVSSSA